MEPLSILKILRFVGIMPTSGKTSSPEKKHNIWGLISDFLSRRQNRPSNQPNTRRRSASDVDRVLYPDPNHRHMGRQDVQVGNGSKP